MPSEKTKSGSDKPAFQAVRTRPLYEAVDAARGRDDVNSSSGESSAVLRRRAASGTSTAVMNNTLAPGERLAETAISRAGSPSLLGSATRPPLPSLLGLRLGLRLGLAGSEKEGGLS